MKNLIRTTLVMLTLLATMSSCEKEELIPTIDLPVEITEYISTHFPNNPIVQSVLDQEGLTKTYEILLEGNFRLEFNNKYEVTDIDGLTQLPNSVIPQPILDYVAQNYPDNFIIGWELERTHQQVELNNNIELEFEMDGTFIRIDID